MNLAEKIKLRGALKINISHPLYQEGQGVCNQKTQFLELPLNILKLSWHRYKSSVVSLMFLMLCSTVFAAEPATKVDRFTDTEVFSVLIGLMVFFIILIVIVADAIKSMLSNKELWQGKSHLKKVVSIVGFLTLGLGSFDTMAAGTTSDSTIVMTDDLFWMLVSINVFLFCVLLFLLYTLKGLIHDLKEEEDREKEFNDDFSILGLKFSDAVPIENEAEILMDHEYDGIRELDNNLPPWWISMFYICIGFAVIYLIHFHVISIPGLDKLVLLGQVERGSQTEQYNLEMKKAESQKAAFTAKAANSVDELSVTVVTNETRIANGKNLYRANCVACHGAEGQGGVGPNFADEYWINGGGIHNVFKTIKYGVPSKGMISWQGQLSPSQIQDVASFILTFQGTNPANGKEPQGEIWKEEIIENTIIAIDSVQMEVEQTKESSKN